jgi:DNA primase
MPLIQDLPSAVERDTYVQQLARLLKVDERSLLGDHGWVSRPAQRRRKPSRSKTKESISDSQTPETRVSQPIKKLEERILSIIIRLPELIYRVNRTLHETELERMSILDFHFTNHQEIFKVALEALEQDHVEPLDFTLENLPYPLLDYADNILMQSKDINLYEEKVLKELLSSILQLRERHIHQSINQLHFLMVEAQDQGALLTEEYQKAIHANNKILINIQRILKTPMSQAFTG